MDSRISHPELERLLTHQDWLRALARKLVGDSQAAEDLVQETWMAAMKSPPDPNRPARPWLAGVVRRLASMRARGEGRRTRRQNAVAVRDELPSTADLVEGVDTQRRLVSEVLKLSEPYRTTVMLRYFNNLSSAEIARHQEVPAGTVRWRLKRGLDELRERLDDSFGSRENWCIALLPMAKFGIGAGAGTAGTTSAVGSVLASAGALRVVAGLLFLLGAFYVTPLVAGKLRTVMAGERTAELASLEPEGAPEVAEAPERVSVPLTERDAVAPSERAIRFLEPNQEPIAGLLVVLPEGDRALESTTDEEGVARFVTAQENAELYLRREGSFLQRVPVTFTAKQLDQVLAWDGQLEGRVFAAASQAGEGLALEGLPLRLDSDQQLWEGEPIPQAVLAFFPGPSTIEVATGAGGDFQFRHLPLNWSGKLWLPEGVTVNGASRRDEAGRYVYFNGPRRDALVAVRQLPRLAGRIVGSDGAPKAGATVRVWVDGAQQPIAAEAALEGTFGLQLDSTGELGTRIEVVTADGLLQRNLTLPGQRMSVDFSLGDIEVMPTTRIRFQASDLDGNWIAGARGILNGNVLPGISSGEDGYGEVILPPEVDACSILAPGFQPREVTLQGTTEEWEVQLQPATSVRLHVLGQDNLSLKNARLRVWSSGPLFAHGDPMGPNEMNKAGMLGTFLGQGAANEQAFSRFVTDETGQVRLVDVVDGAPIWVDVVDRLGMSIYQHRVGPLSEGEERVEQILVPDVLRSFYGIVRDQAGHPLVGAQVALTDSAGKTVSLDTNLDGRVGFQDLAGEHYGLTLTKRGYVEVVLDDLTLSGSLGSHPEQPMELNMARGVDIAVLIVDQDDRPVYGGALRAQRQSDKMQYTATPAGGADQTLQDLDQGLVTVTLALAGVEYTEVIDPSLSRSVEFRVPAHGSAEVSLRLLELMDAQAPLRLVATALDGTEGPMADRGPVILPIGARTGSEAIASFPSLLPGAYRLNLQAPAGDDSDSWSDVATAVRFEVSLGEPAQIQVEAISPMERLPR